MAKKPHKFAWNGVDIDTALSASDLMSICTQVAAENIGGLFKTAHRLEEAARDDTAIAYVVKSSLVRAFQFMTFAVETTPAGGRTTFTTSIGTYSTTQYRVLYVIPLGGPEMVAHPTYMKFVRTVANTVAQADPTARIRVREGKRGPEPLPPLVAAQPAPQPDLVPADEIPVVSIAMETIAAPSPSLPLEPDEIVTPTPTPTPVAPLTAAPPAAVLPSAVDDATTRVPRRVRPQSSWALELPDGRRFTVGSPVFFGRDPVSDGNLSAQLVEVPESSRSVSKTHAVIQSSNGRITVTDLHSANGSVIVADNGHETECAPGVPALLRAGATVELGDYAIKLLEVKAND